MGNFSYVKISINSHMLCTKTFQTNDHLVRETNNSEFSSYTDARGKKGWATVQNNIDCNENSNKK